jgi:hypothetical protein
MPVGSRDMGMGKFLRLDPDSYAFSNLSSVLLYPVLIVIIESDCSCARCSKHTR